MAGSTMLVLTKARLLAALNGFFRDQGLNVWESAPEQALQEARDNRPGMILLDVDLPENFAFRLCWKIKSDPALSDIMIVVVYDELTGGPAQADEVMAAGADSQLAIPENGELLPLRLRPILKLVRMGELLRQKIEALQETTAKLSTSSQTFIKAFRNNPAAMAMIRDEDGRLFEINQAFSRLVGYTRREAVGRTMLELNVFEDISQRQAILLELQNKGFVAEREVRFHTKDGSTRLGMFSIENLELSGKKIRLMVINDITELRQAYDALEQSNEKIAIDGSGLGVWDFRVPEGYVTINDAWARMLGLQRESLGQVTFETWKDRCHPEDLPKVLEMLQRHIDGDDEMFSAEMRMRHEDGSWVWILTRGKVTLRADDGSPLRIAGTHSNISRRKAAELHAIAANNYNRGLLEASLDPLVTIGSDGRIQDVNRATEKIIGLSREDLICTDFSDYFTEPNHARDGYLKVFHDSYVRDYPLVLRHVDGHVTPVLYNATVYRDSEGNVAGVFAAARDISSQLETESKLRALSQALEDGPSSVYITDKNGVIEHVNKAFTRISGYMPDEVIGKSAAILRSDFHPESFFEEIWRALRSGQTWKGEMCRCRKDGENYWVSTFFTPVRDFAGEVVRYVTISEDITARHRSEEYLKQAKEHAEEASRAKSIFLANMSHEIRTPLNAIIGYAQWLQGDETLRAEARERLDIINRSGSHLLQLINSLLEISKLDAGRITAEKNPFSPKLLLKTVVEMFQLQIQSRGLEWIVEIPPELPDSCVGDDGKIRQIIINLLGNAAKFTQKGSVRLTASCDTSGEIPLWMVQVADTGPGMCAEEISRLFQRFEQTTLGRRMQAGTGLGLAISREYARLMDGDLTASSDPGFGSCFTLVVPIPDARFDAQPRRILPEIEAIAEQIADESPRALMQNEVISLPESLRESLMRAVSHGDSSQLTRILLEMESSHLSYSLRLRELAEQYEYDSLLEILKNPDSPSSTHHS